MKYVNVVHLPFLGRTGVGNAHSSGVECAHNSERPQVQYRGPKGGMCAREGLLRSIPNIQDGEDKARGLELTEGCLIVLLKWVKILTL